MKHATWCAAIALLLVAESLDAQPRPNFSGHWVRVGPATTLPVPDMVVTHTANTLTTSHASEGGGHKIVYKLDGSENDTTIADVQSTARAAWNNDKLEIVRTDDYPDGRKRQNRQVWSLDPSGNLVIEATDGLAGETPTTRTAVYKKRQ